jgi:hypothetical protein
MRWPSKETREHWDFVFKGIQSAAVVIGVLWAAYTFWDTRNRELQKPFDEKQLALYADAARVLAHISAGGTDPDTTLRFWELYYGELPLVESSGPGSIAEVMNKFCHAKVPEGLCSDKPDTKELSPDNPKGIAIELANRASGEIKKRWGDKH